MKTYEVTYIFRKNCRFGVGIAYRCIVTTDNKKQADDFAYELYREQTCRPYSREMFKVEIETFE